jgi:hypothetical protein
MNALPFESADVAEAVAHEIEGKAFAVGRKG